eukprot:Awhi_evm2s1822
MLSHIVNTPSSPTVDGSKKEKAKTEMEIATHHKKQNAEQNFENLNEIFSFNVQLFELSLSHNCLSNFLLTDAITALQLGAQCLGSIKKRNEKKRKKNSNDEIDYTQAFQSLLLHSCLLLFSEPKEFGPIIHDLVSCYEKLHGDQKKTKAKMQIEGEEAEEDISPIGVVTGNEISSCHIHFYTLTHTYKDTIVDRKAHNNKPKDR